MSKYFVKRPLRRPPVHPGEILREDDRRTLQYQDRYVKERLKESGLTVLLAGQKQAVDLRLADRGYVIDNGAIWYHGTRRARAKNVIK